MTAYLGPPKETYRMDLPSFSSPDFKTDFAPKCGPGFFPGASGYFHGCSPGGSGRIVFFGTDFGPQRFWKEEVTEGAGEKRTQQTLCNLRCLVEEAGIDPCDCHLTNSVLALATPNDMTVNNAVYTRREYRCYLKLCGNFHRDWISRHKPELVVLMGTPNIHTYRHFLFNRAHPIHPMLAAAWGDYRAPWECVYQEQKELVRTGRGIVKCCGSAL